MMFSWFLICEVLPR